MLAELALPPPKKEKAQAKLRPYDVEEARDECLTAFAFLVRCFRSENETWSCYSKGHLP